MFPVNLGWVTYNFFYGDVYWGPGTVVTRLDYASYRFTGNTLNHTLYMRRNGYASGYGECIGYITGSYVFGPRATCTVYVP